jgi:hypothetical protein
VGQELLFVKRLPRPRHDLGGNRLARERFRWIRLTGFHRLLLPEVLDNTAIIPRLKVRREADEEACRSIAASVSCIRSLGDVFDPASTPDPFYLARLLLRRLVGRLLLSRLSGEAGYVL